ncbi:MAG: diacylglycerol kinase [Acidimicrobiales bacterium]|nr:diacylglycerol kinase [Acidimicrobiales bacterium]
MTDQSIGVGDWSQAQKPQTRTSTTVIYNPVAGSAPDKEELSARLGDDIELVATSETDPGTGQAAEAVERGANHVVACGGDGTVRAVLESLVGTEAILGLLPFGTGNLLASNLGLESGFDGYIDTAPENVRRIDTGRVNGESFAVMAGTGFDAEMMADAPSSVKERLGVVAYVIAAARHLRDDLIRTTIDIDGQRWFDGRSAMVLVGNFGTISGGIEVFPDAQPDDGQLDVLVLSASSLRDWAKIAWRIVRRQTLADVPAERTKAADIVVATSRPRRWELDGDERKPADRLHFTVEPASLSVTHSSEAIGETRQEREASNA